MMTGSASKKSKTVWLDKPKSAEAAYKTEPNNPAPPAPEDQALKTDLKMSNYLKEL